MSAETVKDWMHAGVVSCRPETPVAEAARIMDARDVSALVVVDDAGDAVGVISRTDLVNARFVQPYFKHWPGMSAAHLMSRKVVSVAADTPIADAARLLGEKRIHRLVVVERKGRRLRPVGILSVTDLARRLAEAEER